MTAARTANAGQSNGHLEAALSARRLGLSVIPCDPSTKRPLLNSWAVYQEQAPAEVELRTWWTRWPNAAIAVVTGSVSGVVVVDLDDASPEAAEEIERQFGTTCRVARTPRGGAHFYYRHPGQAIGNKVRLPGFAFAVDLRGDGGYVLAPPSAGYTWERRDTFEALPEFPGLPEADSGARHGGNRTTSWGDLAEGVEEGRRNASLARLAGKMLSDGMRPEWVRLAAHGFGIRCTPPMDRGEIGRTVTSIICREAAAQRADVEDHEPEPVMSEFPTEAFRGTFADFATYMKPVTGASLPHLFAAWWAALSAAIGDRRWGTWSGRVVAVVYTLCCGPTGDHKSTAMDRALELLPDTCRRVDGVTSDAGLFDALEEADGRTLVLHFDELAYLTKMASLSGSTLDAMLNRLWDAPAFLDRNLSNRARTGGGARRAERPRVCLLGGTHPDTFWRTISDPTLAIAGGFVNRLAVFVVERGRSLEETAEPDARAGAQLREHLGAMCNLPVSPVGLTDDSRRLWREFSRQRERRLAELPAERAAIAKRVRDHVARLALVYATDNRATMIERDDLEAAVAVGAFLEASYERLLLARQPERGPARTARLEAIARRVLARRRGVFHSARDVLRAWPNAERPSSEEVRRALRAMDGVEAQAGSGRQKERYRLAAYRRTDT
ncbi:MAG: bifunctional DNA primase/polymerase [Planctomycetota bacterium]|jgi:hypothetical protein